MGKATGFLEATREGPSRRPVAERLRDWKEVYLPTAEEPLRSQAARCMDCGVPFCHRGCPLGNLIPEWNDLVYGGRWREAIDRLHATNNFPEFTGRLCPAPCEASCVLAINQPAVTIEQIEKTIAERAWAEGWIAPCPPARETGRRVAIVGSGPAGLACAQNLRRAGHAVIVYERDDRIGGLLRYGIPEFKMEKAVLDRRLAQMEAEGVVFRTNAHVGVEIDPERLRREHDALVLCGGARAPRDLKVPGRDLGGIHFAMEFLSQANRAALGEAVPGQITAAGKDVVIIGGGDTGADCLGTVHRQGARSVVQLEILPRPPDSPDDPPGRNPAWPNWPQIFRTSSAHEEGGIRDFAVTTTAFEGSGRVERLRCARVEWVPGPDGRLGPREVPGTEFECKADLVLLAMGFLGPERGGMLEALDVSLDSRGYVATDEKKMTNVPGIFAAGDMARGQSLIVWAIAEGRQAARGVDLFLMGETALQAP